MEEKKTKTYTDKEVKKLLQEQKDKCKEAIDKDNLSAANAKKKINEVKLVK